MNNITVGIVGFQGGVAEHVSAFASLGIQVRIIKLPDDIQDITHLVIPGGESSVIGKFLEESKLSEVIKKRLQEHTLIVWGTCAGAILLGRSSSPYALNLMDIDVDRNAYGRQLQSFSAKLRTSIGEMKAIFIRAPIITKIGPEVEILAEHEGKPVLCKQKNMLASSFHPELTDDTVVQQYFLQM